ncbi:MAG: hypothetical protein WC595_02445 [Candidatus Nanoarchaeia archaeon]
MKLSPIVLKGFEGREEALKEIKRYIDDITPVMFYRTNDLVHSRRVLAHLDAALPDILSVYGIKFDMGFARTEALVHDDAEMITGDPSLHAKEQMDETELALLAQQELDAIPQLIARYSPSANGYNYEKLLLAAKHKDRLEAQFVSYFDKFDGAGEA